MVISHRAVTPVTLLSSTADARDGPLANAYRSGETRVLTAPGLLACRVSPPRDQRFGEVLLDAGSGFNTHPLDNADEVGLDSLDRISVVKSVEQRAEVPVVLVLRLGSLADANR